MCLRSGLDSNLSDNSDNLNKPWRKYIIMTNCMYITHMGKKTEKDQSICIGTFRNISKEDWVKMCNISGNTLNSIEEHNNLNISKADLRLKRLSYFDKN